MVNSKTDIYGIGTLIQALITCRTPLDDLYTGPPIRAALGYAKNRASLAKQKKVTLWPCLFTSVNFKITFFKKSTYFGMRDICLEEVLHKKLVHSCTYSSPIVRTVGIRINSIRLTEPSMTEPFV